MISWYLILLLTLLIIFLDVVYSLRHTRRFKLINRTLGYYLLLQAPDPVDLKHLIKIAQKYGGNIIFTLFWVKAVIVTKSWLTNFILTSQSFVVNRKAEPYKYISRWLGDGLLTSSGVKWQKRRKLLTPTFHFSMLEHYINIFNRVSNQFIKQVGFQTNNDGFDICHIVSLQTLDIICECAMGVQINALCNQNTSYVKDVEKICEIYGKRMISIYYFDSLFRLTRNYRKEKEIIVRLHAFTHNIIRERRAEIFKAKERNTDFKPKIFLDLLLMSTIQDEILSDVDIAAEVDTFLFEGHDTTASAISFTLFSIANHQNIQDKLYKEQLEVMGADMSRDCDINLLNEMKYLEMVIKESLRMYPAVPIIARQSDGTMYFDNDNCLSHDTLILLGIYGLHMDPENFSEPEKFDPERFTAENIGNREGFTYIPFSAGSRNCIGQKFALLEMKTTLSKLLRNYKLLPVIPKHLPKLIFQLTLKSRNGLKIRLQKR